MLFIQNLLWFEQIEPTVVGNNFSLKSSVIRVTIALRVFFTHILITESSKHNLDWIHINLFALFSNPTTKKMESIMSVVSIVETCHL